MDHDPVSFAGEPPPVRHPMKIPSYLHSLLEMDHQRPGSMSVGGGKQCPIKNRNALILLERISSFPFFTLCPRSHFSDRSLLSQEPSMCGVLPTSRLASTGRLPVPQLGVSITQQPGAGHGGSAEIVRECADAPDQPRVLCSSPWLSIAATAGTAFSVFWVP